MSFDLFLNALAAVLFVAVLAAAGFFLLRGLRGQPRPAAPAADPAAPAPCTPAQRLRQVLRRWQWGYVLVAGLFLYPLQINWQARYAAWQAGHADGLTAAAAVLGKVVDPDQVYSKMSLAVGVFCLINLLAWGALNLVLDVLTNWAKGGYADPEKAAAAGLPAPVVGFKRTFLTLDPLPRIGVYFLFFALEIYAAAAAVEHAFRIQ